MAMNRKIFIISVLTLFLDQLSKIMIGIWLSVGESIVVIKNFFAIHFIENYGAAWSLFDNKVGLLILFSLFALVIVVRYMYNFKLNERNTLAFGLMIGGIFGNLIDRVFLGYVRDFLSFKIFSYHYPIFNIADTAIVVGVFLLIVAILKGEDTHEKNSH